MYSNFSPYKILCTLQHEQLKPLKVFAFKRCCLAIWLAFFILLSLAQSVLAQENAPNSKIAPYWLKQAQLDLLPDPKPILSPQCNGVFFQAPTLDAQQEKGAKEQQSISADKALYEANGTSTFEGHVVLQQGPQRITSDRLYYHHTSNTIELDGNVIFNNDGLLIASEQAKHNANEESSELNDAEFLIFESGLNGRAKSISLSENEVNVQHSRMTSCPPGEEHWLLKSSELHLDQEKGWGYAKHASLHIGQVPIMYTPYFTFPIDDRRKSGFLYPSLGNDSINGADVSLPYYFNIAPNYDATLTPRILSKRGQQLAGEFRYLNRLGEGKLGGDYLGQDQLNPLYSERKQVQWQHEARFQENWFFNSRYFYLSDPDYLDDLDSFSSNTNLGYVERNARIDYFKQNIYFSLLAQDFQVLDTINTLDQPYRLAPQMNTGISLPVKNTVFEISFAEQLSRFERDIDTSTIDAVAISNGEISTGLRNVFIPTLHADLSGAAYFFKPAAAVHIRNYRLENYQALDTNEDIHRSIPIYTLDSGLIFERELNLQQNAYTQTLEPRIFLVKIPFKDQSDIPNFDSATLSSNDSQLFRALRYSGHDLIGDTEQGTVGLSSKLYDNTQRERADFSLGQIFYFEDRKILLEANEDTLAEQSPVFASMQLRLLQNWFFKQGVEWNSDNNHLEQFSTLVSFKSDANHIANFEYRYRPESSNIAQEETRASFVWPLHHRWKALSYWNFDLNQHSTIELASGLEYENCCLVVRVLNQKWLRKISSTNSYESANKQSLELQLKGLGNLNDQISEYFKGKIHGYNI